MDIIKAFQKNEVGINITIKGTYENPLFRASDIGEVLEIGNIRSSIQDFDETEKHCVDITDAIGRERETTFLTEKGLYQVLFTSRKPIAKLFKNWVCEVIKEIRLHNVYDLQKQLQIKDKEIDNIKLNNQNNILLNFENKQVVYIIQVEENIRKFGHTKDIKNRLNAHRQEFGLEIKLIYIFETLYNREFENTIKKDPIICPNIISKNYKNNQTELIQLSDNFTSETLTNRLNELKRNINGELISSLSKDKDELEIKTKNLELENDKLKKELLESQIIIVKLNKHIDILVKKGYIKKTSEDHTCTRCNKSKNAEEFNINPISGRPKSLCKLCEEINLIKYEEENKERIEIENQKNKEKEEEIKLIRLKLLESTELMNCTRCKENKTAKEIGVNVRTNEYYKICEICREKQLPKTMIMIQARLPKEGETECSKCHNIFENTFNEISRQNYKNCFNCREKDRLNTERDKKLLKTGGGIINCIRCKEPFETELTKKKDSYFKQCTKCRR